ncbi:STAS domain-containing protein [uncultured Ramlibacter sp.]|uniref:STAS domain-containing protein n=1 Tax=uncultured Ramlibacter sp. TaxID=260755 RepID=UPI00262C13B0|nr:STAS domain-containing protein [uncultured Ramlibacter sp.]
MEIHVEHRAPATVVRIVGNVDGLTAEALLAQLQAHVGEGHVYLVGDLSGVGYTSSAGLRALLAVVRDTRSSGGDLRLAAVHAPVLKILELSGFTSILKVFDDVDGAVASYSA